MLYFFFLLAALAQMTCDRTDTIFLMCCGAVQFGAYFYTLYKKEQIDVTKMLIFGIFVRFLLVFAIPNLSDDVYRFLWDGTLWHDGLHPFVATPTVVLRQHTTPILVELYPLLNSPDYFTVYPSVCQAAFWLATAVAKSCTNNAHTYIYVSAIVLKMLLAFAECGTLVLLYKTLPILGLSPNKSLIYALNPLVIHEICGNAHCEGFMIFFLTATVWVLASAATHKKVCLSALLFSLAICSKLLPLIFLPLLFALKRLDAAPKDGKLVPFMSCALLFTIILFIPLYNADFVAHFSASLNLYFQKFEYNASIYYIVRAFGIWLKGYNWISVVGPSVALLGVLGILACAAHLSLRVKNIKHLVTNQVATQIGGYALFSITIYLLCTTILHPWYIILPVFLSCFTNFKYPIAWSLLIFITYVNYANIPFQENTWVLGLEYSILSITIGLDFKNKQKTKI
jgi:hypothetical protein